MRQSSAPAIKPSPNIKGASRNADSPSPSSVFVTMAVDMSWRLVLVVFMPVVLGAELDKHFKTSYALIAGLIVAAIGMSLVFWRTLRVANQMPVPKLTDKQKQAIRKQYEEDDND